MTRTLLVTSCALVLSASLAQGAEYFIYRDPGGRIVLSNIRPTRPAEVLERYELQDITEEALRAASAIGDDRIQMRSQGYVVPDSFTHGTSEQRFHWFQKGFVTGDLRQSDTFAEGSM